MTKDPWRSVKIRQSMLDRFSRIADAKFGDKWFQIWERVAELAEKGKKRGKR